MADTTPRGVRYPTELDKIKDGSSPSALADDFRDLAATADAAIAAGVNEAVNDAQGKYGGLPARVTAVEQKNAQQDQTIRDVSDRVQALVDATQAIDAPKGFDANTVSGQVVHRVDSADDASNMPGPGSWILWSTPQADISMQQIALRYSGSEPRLFVRVKTSAAEWLGWNRIDADKLAERLYSIEATNADLDERLAAAGLENTRQDQRLESLENLRPVKAVRLENGKWVWDPGNATHFVLIDHNGKPTARATPWPTPNTSTPTFSW